MLQALVKNKMADLGMTANAVSKEIGVAHTTILRLLKGDQVDLSTIEKIANWLGVSMSTVLDVDQNDDLPKKIALLIEREPKLKKLFEDAVQSVENGEISPDDFTDILGYASYKFSTGRKNKNGKASIPRGN